MEDKKERGIKRCSGDYDSGSKKSNPKKTTNNKNNKNNKTRQNTKLRVVYSLTETCGKTNHSKALLKPVHQLYCLTRKGNLHDRKRYSNRAQLILQIRVSELRLTLQLSNCTWENGNHHTNKSSIDLWGCAAATPGDILGPPQARHLKKSNRNYIKDPKTGKYATS